MGPARAPVRSRNEDKLERRRQRPITITKALRAKDEHGWIGLLRFLIDHMQRRHRLYERRGWRIRRSDAAQ